MKVKIKINKKRPELRAFQNIPFVLSIIGAASVAIISAFKGNWLTAIWATFAAVFDTIAEINQVYIEDHREIIETILEDDLKKDEEIAALQEEINKLKQ